MDQPAPAHATFSRFRGRLAKKAMVQLNSALLSQFDRLGITIDEGIAVNARLIKSASKTGFQRQARSIAPKAR
jgi:IS5 family transposase